MLAAWRLGAAANEAGYQVRDSGAKLLLTSSADGAEAMSYGVPVLLADELKTVPSGTLGEPGTELDDLALLIYTSGSTGRPKGVMLDHANLLAMASSIGEAMRIDRDDHCLLVLPLFHVNAICVSCLAPMLAGGQITVLARFSPSTFLDAIERHRPTITCLVPAAMQMLLDHPLTSTADFSCLRSMIYAGSPISSKTLARALDVFDCEMNQFYGATEMWIITLLRPHQHDLQSPEVLTSCGKPMPFVEIKVVDPDGAEVPDGEIGRASCRERVSYHV